MTNVIYFDAYDADILETAYRKAGVTIEVKNDKAHDLKELRKWALGEGINVRIEHVQPDTDKRTFAQQLLPLFQKYPDAVKCLTSLCDDSSEPAQVEEEAPTEATAPAQVEEATPAPQEDSKPVEVTSSPTGPLYLSQWLEDNDLLGVAVKGLGNRLSQDLTGDKPKLTFAVVRPSGEISRKFAVIGKDDERKLVRDYSHKRKAMEDGLPGFQAYISDYVIRDVDAFSKWFTEYNGSNKPAKTPVKTYSDAELDELERNNPEEFSKVMGRMLGASKTKPNTTQALFDAIVTEVDYAHKHRDIVKLGELRQRLNGLNPRGNRELLKAKTELFSTIDNRVKSLKEATA